MHPVATRRSAAFMLVELLVVITIIVVLAALVIAVMAAVRGAAAKAACANNLRQIGQGLISYDQENGRLPGSEGHKTISDLPSFIDALVKGQRYPAATFVCPSSEADRPTGYEMNLKYVGLPRSRGRADVILASESGSCVQCHEGTIAGVGHGSVANHLFFDGHVEALPKPTAGRMPSPPTPVPRT